MVGSHAVFPPFFTNLPLPFTPEPPHRAVPRPPLHTPTGIAFSLPVTPVCKDFLSFLYSYGFISFYACDGRKG